MGIFNRKKQSQNKQDKRKQDREQQDNNPAFNEQVERLLAMNGMLQNGR
ncbi:hypothetical protein G4Y79_09730 [Phototrophicus methaneseepsis]|uniref:Uncharacterized protein n=1 Tax=Phototrophicus methaneseepsis TaxID=2710758 RepID=A0A7S8ED37_9CHLR|nr:hypothetical protein [Phototrophicus methaneseepsis]QPC84634.1 hypothetical protein G4Y79_09730 [Phototrophicus methaneseepsis]